MTKTFTAAELKETFTPSELRLIPYMALPIKVAAGALDIHENTVKFHAKNIEAKIGVGNRPSAIAVLAKSGVDFLLLGPDGRIVE